MLFCKSLFPSCERKCVVRVLIDLLIFTTGVILFRIILHSPPPPFRRGYFCDDESIRYPYKEDTVSAGVLFSTCFVVPVIIIIVSEISQQSKVEQNSTTSEMILFKCRIPITFRRILFSTYIFTFGFFINTIMLQFLKLIVGRLRPNFLDVCQSDFDCSKQPDSHLYVQDYNCTNSDAANVQESRFSFPSGHTMLATYGMLFAIIYSHYRLHVPYSRLFKPTLQALLFLIGAYISLSRIQDNMHHWSDVFAGSVLGALDCFWAFSFQPHMLGKARREEYLNKEDPEGGLHDRNLSSSAETTN